MVRKIAFFLRKPDFCELTLNLAVLMDRWLGSWVTSISLTTPDWHFPIWASLTRDCFLLYCVRIELFEARVDCNIPLIQLLGSKYPVWIHVNSTAHKLYFFLVLVDSTHVERAKLPFAEEKKVIQSHQCPSPHLHNHILENDRSEQNCSSQGIFMLTKYCCNIWTSRLGISRLKLFVSEFLF